MTTIAQKHITITQNDLIRRATLVKDKDLLKKSPGFNTSAFMPFQPPDLAGNRYRYKLYRFLSDNIPVINSCLATWVRLSSAPGNFKIITSSGSTDRSTAEKKLTGLTAKLYHGASGRGGLVTFLSDLFLISR